MPMALIYYSEGYEAKSAKKKVNGVESRNSLPGFSPGGVAQDVFNSQGSA